MTTYTIKPRACNNAYGVCFEVWQDDVVPLGIFTRRFWAEAWIADRLAEWAAR